MKVLLLILLLSLNYKNGQSDNAFFGLLDLSQILNPEKSINFAEIYNLYKQKTFVKEVKSNTELSTRAPTIIMPVTGGNFSHLLLQKKILLLFY